MKNSILRTITLAALPGCALFAQDITGNWQGTLTAPNKQELRVVFKIAKASAGLNAVFYSIDQPGPGIGAAVAVQGANVKITIQPIDGVYEGKLDSDGVNLTGNWSQRGGPPLALNLKHVTGQAAWEIPAPPAPLKPMAADANPVFEVATIKPSKPDAPGKAFGIRGRQFSTLNTTLSNMIVFAYGVHPRQILGAPVWIDDDKYDILAKPDGEGQPSQTQWKVMLQKMLADRFKLSFHHDKRELSVYAIVVGKNGPKLTKSQGDPNGLPGLFFRGLGDMPARNANMADLAGLLQSAVLDRPVVDQTGLQGRFDFELKWSPDENQFTSMGIKVPPPSTSPDAPPDLFTAMQEELGLKLVSTKATVDVLVIDRAEKPTEN